MIENKEKIGMEFKTNRIEALNDGIFAIAMTILIISFETLFQQPDFLSDSSLQSLMSQLWPDFLHYCISFLLLGVFWIQHHNHSHYIKRSNTKSLYINIIGLMFISLIPFSASVASDYAHLRTAALLFEINLLLAGVAFFGYWAYASGKRRLTDDSLDAKTVSYYTRRSLVIPVVSLIAICLAFVNPRISTMLYLLVPVILWVYK